MSQALLTMIVLGLAGQPSPALKDDANSETAQQKKWHEYYQARAATYEIRIEDNPQPLALEPKPVLFWSNPVRIGETNGAVFLWTHAGRPEAVGTIFSFLDRKNPDLRVVAHSFHSLSLKPLAATREGRASWSISSAGIEPKPITDSPPPAGTASLRLAQMRELARDFKASTSQDGIERELRLLPQPIFRQEEGSREVLDGSLFTFVTGTDPELMLLIEIRESSGVPRWHYAAARFTDLSVRLWNKQAEVWSYVRGSAASDGTSAYVTGRVGTRSSTIE